jgi:hypothetical protein
VSRPEDVELGTREAAGVARLAGATGRPVELDVVDLNFLHSSEAIGYVRYHPSYRRAGLGYCLLRFAAKGARAVRFGLRGPDAAMRGTAILFVVETANQFASIRPVLEHLPESGVLSLNSTFGTPVPEARAYLASLPHLGEALRRRRAARGYLRTAFEHAFDEYLLTFGYHGLLRAVLGRLMPDVVVVANDHNMRTRTAAAVAQALGIATAYVQHASVTEKFPPLRFDVSLLDGLDAAEKYRAAGTVAVRAFLTGVAKADPVRASLARRVALPRDLGVCVNLLDPTEAVVSFVERAVPLMTERTLVLRPHPSDRRPWRSLVSVPVSDSAVEPSFEFLGRVGAIVSGPSNIILEAALAGVPSTFFDFAGLGVDGYGFVAHGLCAHARTADEAIAALASGAALQPVDPAVLRRYSAAVGTPFDGRSAELIGQLLRELAADGIDERRWRRRDDFTSFDVFELRGA